MKYPMRAMTILGVAGAALLAGCGGSSHPAATSPRSPTSASPLAATATTSTTAAVNYGAKYLAIINPLNAALKNSPASPSAAQLQALATQIDQREAKLLAVQWPGQAETDVHTLVTDMGQLAAAVQNNDGSAVTNAGQAVASASGIVRSDLGLPSNLG
jgi:hypothetical protein